jgi:hypothetical protein
LLKATGEFSPDAKCMFSTDRFTPNQYGDNLCKFEAGSACGPFTWAFIKELVLYIIESKEDGFAVDNLEFTEDYIRECELDSQNVRRIVRLLVYMEKERQKAFFAEAGDDGGYT